MNPKQNHALSIQVSLNGLSFCVKNTETNTVILLYNSTFNSKQTPFKVLDILNKELDSETFKDYSFKEIMIIHRNELSTLVPKEFFDEARIADYLKFNAKILKSDYITFDEIYDIECVNVYVPLININNSIIDRYGEFTYKHASTVLIESILTLKQTLKNTIAFIHLQNSSFELVIMNKQNVLLYNSFSFNSIEDISYYILFTYEQLQLNVENTPLRFLGGVEREDDIFEIVYKYIRDVDILPLSLDLKFDTSITDETKLKNYIALNSFI